MKTLTADQLDEMFRVPDLDNDGRWNVEEFLTLSNPDKDETIIINQTFTNADKNADGYITAPEMRTIIKNLTPQKMGMLMRSMDTDGDSKINSTEFLSSVKNAHSGRYKSHGQEVYENGCHFRAFDEDRDAFVSRAEYDNFIRVFAPEPYYYRPTLKSFTRKTFGQEWHFFNFQNHWNELTDIDMLRYNEMNDDTFKEADTNSDEKLSYDEFVFSHDIYSRIRSSRKWYTCTGWGCEMIQHDALLE
jgi:Ca2+-binding EF-hand superfamily protein